MPAYKDTNGTYFVSFYYEDFRGVKKRKMKRGFARRRDALDWERRFLLQSTADLNMKFSDFVEIYRNDKQMRIRESTWESKNNMIDLKILPYFKDRPINAIEPKDIIAWQNEIMNLKKPNGEPYSTTYLKSIHSQLSAIFNHAVRYYRLQKNPAEIVGNMGKDSHKEMLFWTKDEYLKFAKVMMDKPTSYYAFEVLYWCGIRLGDDDDKIRLNQRKPSKYKGLRRFGPEKNLQRINKFMKERPIFYKNLIQMKENIRFYLRCFYCITKVMILQFNSENRTELARNG